jgi:hypothetical protein
MLVSEWLGGWRSRRDPRGMRDVSEDARDINIGAKMTSDKATAIERDHHITHANHLFDIAGSHDEHISAIAKLTHQAIEFRPRADIDAARWFVTSASPPADGRILGFGPANCRPNSFSR